MVDLVVGLMLAAEVEEVVVAVGVAVLGRFCGDCDAALLLPSMVAVFVYFGASGFLQQKAMQEKE